MMADAGLTCLPLHAELAEGWALDAGEELAPICAVVGGVVANNVIRAVSHVNEPLYNLFLYGVHDGMGLVETLLGEDAS